MTNLISIVIDSRPRQSVESSHRMPFERDNDTSSVDSLAATMGSGSGISRYRRSSEYIYIIS